MIYDIIIVGAGIAGLQVATDLSKNHKSKNLKILILEKYQSAGGRMETVKVSPNLHYESGAGRIHSNHKRVLKIVKQYNLQLYPISDKKDWRSCITKETTTDDFFSVFEKYCEILRDLPKEKLQTKTIRDLFIEFQGVELAKNILDTYPYRAELEIMSADSSLDLFTNLEKGRFYTLVEGFSEMIRRIVENLKEFKNVNFKFNHDIHRLEFNSTTKEYTVSGINNTKHIEYIAKRVILALPQEPLKKIYPFSPDHPLLKKVRMEPLLRIYSIYKNSTWFPKNTIVTDSPLRFIIPINKEKGLIMSSYLDARDTDPWLLFTKPEKATILRDRIQDETQALFPELEIPKAEYTKAHLWRQGCTYWLPGNYDYREASKEALYPMPETHPNLHIVGESFSKQQQWIEGALEHAEELVKLILEEL